MFEYISVALGCLSFVLTMVFFFQNRRREKMHEEFFALQITENVKSMSGYFLTVENETKYGEEDEDGGEESVDSMMESLHTFYTRHEQEMKDILYQTKLYLPLWRSLSQEDRNVVNDTLGLFSWLLYEYYNSALPSSLRENNVLGSRDILNAKKYAVAQNAKRIIQCSASDGA